MIRKQLKLVFSFESTENAMATEAFCHNNNLPGRIIPVPTSITAGCGLAWMADVSDKETLLTAFRDADISCQGVYELMI